MQSKRGMLVTEYITPEEAAEIIKSCVKERDHWILQTMWETGGRVSEVLGLISDHIDRLNNCLYLTTLKQKTRTGINPLRRVFLFPESTLCQDLLDYCTREGIGKYDWIFQGQVRKPGKEGQVSPTYMWYLLSSAPHLGDKWKRREGLATAIGIRKMKGDKLKPAWPHLFRHGAAMYIYHRTGRLDVTQKELGHSTIATTEGYAQLLDDARKKIIDGSKENE